MTRTDILRVVTLVAWFLAMSLRGAQRRIIRRLEREGAADPASAIPLTVGSPITRLGLARLRNGGAVVAAGPERFYLDAAGYAGYRQVRRRRGLTVLAIALAAMAVLYLVSLRQRAS